MSKFTDLLLKKNADKIYLVRLKPYNLVTSQIETIYLSTLGYTTKPTDSVPSVHWKALISSIPGFDRNIADILTGQINLDIGSIVVEDDGSMAKYANRAKYVFGGYDFDIQLGGTDFEYADYGTVVSGVMLDTEYMLDSGSKTITIKVGSKDMFLQQKLLQSTKYASAPNAQINAATVPNVFGPCDNIKPVLYDSTNRIYSFGEGESNDVVMVYDNNVEVAETGTAQAGASSTITLAAGASATNNFYNNAEITITSGTGNGQTRIISAYNGTTKVATVSVNWSTNPDNTSVYKVNLFTKDRANSRFTLLTAPTTLASITADVKGKMNKNFILYSQDLSNAVWTKTLTITSNETTAPDNTVTAEGTSTISSDSDSVYQDVTVLASTQYTFSFYSKIKSGSGTQPKLGVYDNTNAAWINADVTYTITSTGFTRITQTFTTPSGCISVRLYPVRGRVTTNLAIYLWGLQLELGASATEYCRNDASRYLQTVSDIVRYMLVNSGGLSLINDLDVSSFDTMNTQNSALVGWYFPEDVKVLDASKVFLDTVGAVGGRNSSGKYQLIRLDAPTTSVLTLTENEIFYIRKDAYKPPLQTISIGYQRCFTVVDNPVQNSATAARQAFVQEPFRYPTETTGASVAVYKLAEKMEAEGSAFYLTGDASAEQVRRKNMFDAASDIFTIEASTNPFNRNLGDTIKIKYPIDDLSSGADMVLIGISPRIADNDVSTVVLTLWRPN